MFIPEGLNIEETEARGELILGLDTLDKYDIKSQNLKTGAKQAILANVQKRYPHLAKKLQQAFLERENQNTRQ